MLNHSPKVDLNHLHALSFWPNGLGRHTSQNYIKFSLEYIDPLKTEEDGQILIHQLDSVLLPEPSLIASTDGSRLKKSHF